MKIKQKDFVNMEINANILMVFFLLKTIPKILRFVNTTKNATVKIAIIYINKVNMSHVNL